VTITHAVTWPSKPSGPRPRSAFASNAMRSPSANGIAIASASSVHVIAKPPAVAAPRRKDAYNAPPSPIPASAVASTSPNMYVVRRGSARACGTRRAPSGGRRNRRSRRRRSKPTPTSRQSSSRRVVESSSRRVAESSSCSST
jgi:hypothetical protein